MNHAKKIEKKSRTSVALFLKTKFFFFFDRKYFFSLNFSERTKNKNFLNEKKKFFIQVFHGEGWPMLLLRLFDEITDLKMSKTNV